MTVCKILIFLLLTSLIIALGQARRISGENGSTLQLVHVLFRHGDRTTDVRTLYPNDPYFNETYYPYGRGELTNEGKKKEYNLGKSLRKRYGRFLGEIYTPDILEAHSSDSNRTKMSLQLVLAGLFPPVGDQIWETGLCWQPIPYNTLPTNQDKLFYGLFCPNFKKYFYELISTPKVLKEFEKNKVTFQYLTENSGKNVSTYWEAFFLYMCLKTEEEFGLELPAWTKKVYPDVLEDFAIKSYELLTANTELRRVVSGFLLKKIIDDTQSKVDGKLIPQTRKLFLYSGHEINLAFLLNTLELYKPHIPPYGAYLLFEVHKIRSIYGFKIYYQDYSLPNPQLLKLQACEDFCPLDKFVPLVEEFLPDENTCPSSID